MKTPAYYDISPRLSEAIGVFPGDVGFQRRVSLSFAQGDNLLLSSIQTTLHLGAHADAPNHYIQPPPHNQKSGPHGIEARDLGLYMGRAQVIRVPVRRGERVQRTHVDGTPIQAPRVLFHTGSFPNPNQWNSDFASLSPELIAYLANQGVRLVGIDTPSVDPENSKLLEAHAAIAHYDLAILEGLTLDHVPDGVYTLIALPLPLVDADASPVRAILVTDLSILNQ